MDRGTVLTVSLVAATQVGTLFQIFLPAFHAIQSSPPREGERVVRQAEAVAGGTGAALAIGVAAATGSPWPLVAGGLAIVAMVAAYEYALQEGPA